MLNLVKNNKRNPETPQLVNRAGERLDSREKGMKRTREKRREARRGAKYHQSK